MKKFFLLLAVMVFLTGLLYSTSMAIAQDKQPAKRAVSAEDAQKVREEVKKIGALFGVEAKEEPKPVRQEPQKGTTIAGVADKALDMLSQAVAAISLTMEKVAPEVWKIMVRQQYAKAVADLSLPWGLFLIILCFVAISKRLWNKEKAIKNRDEVIAKAAAEKKTVDFTDHEMGWRGLITTFIPFVLGLACAIWGAVVIKGSILYLINPQYYAIRDLLQMIMRSGGM